MTEKKSTLTKPDEGLKLISLRLPKDMIEELEKMMKRTDKMLKFNGNKTKSETTLSDMLRFTISRGIQVLRQEIDDAKQSDRT